MNIMLNIFPIIFIIATVFIGIMFILTFALILSPKLRGKMMSRQVKAMKYMVDESASDIENISTNMATASSDGVRITTNAIKKGLTEDGIFCKHCGSMIDADSTFCKNCGKKQ